MDSTGKIIKCKAAVSWERNKPLSIEEVEIDPPEAHEVRIKVIATAICRSDLSALDGVFEAPLFPTVLGHEAGGIVESVGQGVTSVKKGDKVIPCFVPQCNDCRTCRNPESNICEVMPPRLILRESSPRIRCRGKVIHQFMDCSTFSEYAVIPDKCLAKISDKAPLEKVCLIGCGYGTGYGAARKVAKVVPGSTCAVWGLGAIGLATINGCHISGAKRIIAIDVNPNKAEIAKTMGATEFFNPKDHSKPVHEVIVEMTDGGLDYAFECVGNGITIQQAFDSCHSSAGTCVLVGIPPIDHVLNVNTLPLLMGKKLTGTIYGGLKPLDDIPKLVNKYLEKKILLDELITKEMKLDDINEGIQLLRDGKVVRVVLKIGH